MTDDHLAILQRKLKIYIDDESYVYKSSYDFSIDEKTRKWLIIMQKLVDTQTNEARSDVFDRDYAKFRANKLRVVEIINMENPNITKKIVTNKYAPFEIKYEVGFVVEEDKYDYAVNKICSNGIHYFRTLVPAFYYRSVPCDYTGNWIEWYSNGHKLEEGYYVNRQRIGQWTRWNYDKTTKNIRYYEKGISSEWIEHNIKSKNDKNVDKNVM